MTEHEGIKKILLKAVHEIQTNGLRSLADRLLQFLFFNVYLQCRKVLPSNPSGKQIRSGVRVSVDDAKLLDRIIGFPYYEQNEIEFIERYVMTEDVVVDIGGGMGVTGVCAAQQAGKVGKVRIFEASGSCVDQIKTTLDMNTVPATVTVDHAIVAEKTGGIRFDEGHDAKIMSPRELPDCDVLNMDCEGAELPILEHMTVRPRVILVETHSQFGSPKQKILELLDNKGYDVVDILDAGEEMSQIASVARDSDQPSS